MEIDARIITEERYLLDTVAKNFQSLRDAKRKRLSSHEVIGGAKS